MSRKNSSQRVRNRNSLNSNELFNETAFNNRAGWQQYHDKLSELAISMFEWKNLPDGVDPIFMERCLFYQGKVVFFKEDGMEQFVCLPFMAQGQFDIYGVPTRRRAYANNGYTNGDLDTTNSVIIYNNLLRKPTTLDMEIMAKKLYKIDQTENINLNAQKTPVLILCDEKQRLTMKNLYMKYDGNEPFIFGDSQLLNNNQIKALNTGAPFIADKLRELKSQVWNEALTYLGISSINFLKKERMITDEVTRNQGGTIANRYSRLEARRQACEQINKLFGLNISCDFREDYELIQEDVQTTTAEDSEEPKELGGISNE